MSKNNRKEIKGGTTRERSRDWGVVSDVESNESRAIHNRWSEVIGKSTPLLSKDYLESTLYCNGEYGYFLCVCLEVGVDRLLLKTVIDFKDESTFNKEKEHTYKFFITALVNYRKFSNLNNMGLTG